MKGFVRPHLDPDRAGRKGIEHDTVVAEARPPPAMTYLPRLEMFLGGPEHLPGLVIKRHIKVSLGRIVGTQPLEHAARHDERTILPLQPDFLDDDHRRIDPLKLDVDHVGWRTKRSGAAGQRQRRQQDKAGDSHGMARVA